MTLRPRLALGCGGGLAGAGGGDDFGEGGMGVDETDGDVVEGEGALDGQGELGDEVGGVGADDVGS